MARTILFIFVFGIISRMAHAGGRTEVLPVGVWGPSFQTAVLDQLQYYYSSHGELRSLAMRNTFELDSKMISELDRDGKRLVKALNSLSQDKIGDQLTLGTVTIDSQPEISYFAPVLAYGLTSSWTVAIAAPIIRYHNQLSIKVGKSNVKEIKKTIGGLSKEMDNGLDQLDKINVSQQIQESLKNEGYKPLESLDRKFLGDVQLMSLWRFYEGPRYRQQWRVAIQLPTGPKYDPDDLRDTDAFGSAAISQQWIQDFVLNKTFTLSTVAGLKVYLPESIKKRVPKSESDLLPSRSQTEVVRRTIGASYSAGVFLGSEFNHWLSASFGVEHTQKGTDLYEGTSELRYDLLGKNTSRQYTSLVTSVDISSVSSYFRKQFSIPLVASYEVTQILSGENVEDRHQHMIWIKGFYQ